MLDDADGLGSWAWQRLRRIGRRGAGLVASVRTRSPLTTLHTCRTTPKLLEELIVDLLPWGSRLTATAVRRLYLGSGGDLRVAFETLRARYDREFEGVRETARADAGVGR